MLVHNLIQEIKVVLFKLLRVTALYLVWKNINLLLKIITVNIILMQLKIKELEVIVKVKVRVNMIAIQFHL